MQIQAGQREAAFGEGPDKVNRDEAAAEHHHFGAADGGLQPGAVMESGVPIINRRMIAAERNLQMVVLFEADDTAFHLNVEAGRGGGTEAGIAAGGKADFSEEVDAR